MLQSSRIVVKMSINLLGCERGGRTQEARSIGADRKTGSGSPSVGGAD